MKRLALNVWLAVSCFFAFTTGTLAEKCDRLIFYDRGIVKESIEADLTDGTWTTDLLGNPGSMYFHADGSVETFRKDKNKKTVVQIDTWEIQVYDGQTILKLTAPDGTTRALRINPTCDGFAAIDGFGGATDLYKQGNYNALLHQQTKRQLIGNWSAVAQSDLNIHRAIQWHFNEDGTFEFAVAPDLYHSAHHGIWDLSPNGEYIMLYFTNRDDPEAVFVTELLRVRSVDFEDLVLDAKLLPRPLAEFTSNKAVHFEKDFSL